jgi:YaiO family outer membrane protein
MLVAVVIAQAVAADPTFAEAQAARHAGRTAEAIAAFERLSRTQPADADIWLNLGLSYGAAERFVDAERALERAMALAPDYDDARLAHARMAFFRGDRATARARLGPLLSRNPPHAEAEGLRAQLDGAAKPAVVWRVDLAYAHSHLTRGLPDWTATSLVASRRFDRATVAAGVEHTKRFGLEDTYFEALGSRSFGRTGDAYVAVGGAPNADYRAKAAIRAGLSSEVAAATAWRVRLGADASWSRFPVGDVRGLQPHVSVTHGDKITLSVRGVGVVDERDDFRAGYVLRAETALTGRLRVSAGWADAPESSDGVTVKVRAVSGGAAVDLDERSSLRLDVTHEMRDAYDRDEVAVGLARRF